jgi:H+/Cl- antiporter ClcA
MPNLNSPPKLPFFFLILGVISMLAAAAFTYMGRAWVRFSGWVYRAKEPRWFWWQITLYYFVGIWFVGYFLYKVYGLTQ